MNEKRFGPEFGNPEKENSDLTQDQAELVEQWLPKYTAEEPEKVESKFKVARELLAEFEKFEAEHSIEELLAITDLAPEDAPNHPVREPARKALIPIVEKLNHLRDKTTISKSEYAELEAKYKRLSSAVGMINRGKVRH